MAKQTKIAANLAQNYTPSEQAQARQNIGLATVAHTGDFNDLVNKPTNLTGQIQSNWTQDNITAVDYIRNKPEIVAPVNADWNAGSGLAEILNKPTIPEYTAGYGLAMSGTEFAVDTSVVQEKLTAGNNVQITGTTISATDTTYSAGNGLTLSGTEFSVDTSVVQEKLTAGSNVQINGTTISATDTKYTAGTNVQINSSNQISATDTTYSAGSGITLNGTTFSADKTVMQEKLTAGSNVQINDNVISATDTTYTAGTNVQISNANVISATDTTYSAGSNISIDANNVISAASQVNSDWAATSGIAEILHKPETKYWYFDLNGCETTTWATIGPYSVGGTVHLPIQWDDQGTLGRVQVRTNFTSEDPEAFPISQGSSWIVLKKGLWRYTVCVDLEPTTLGTGIAAMSFWVRVMTQGLANYMLVRRIDMPVNNNVQSTYTRQVSGLLYVDVDPTYSNNELDVYRTIHFDFDITGACDAVYRFRQNSIMLERIGV